MRSKEDCLDDLLDDDYPYTTTRNEFVDADQDERTTRAMCNAYELKNDADLLTFAKSHCQSILDAMRERALAASEKSRSPFDEVAA